MRKTLTDQWLHEGLIYKEVQVVRREHVVGLVLAMLVGMVLIGSLWHLGFGN